jgi:4-hydroxy-tetrahydrodipicolinate reductase
MKIKYGIIGCSGRMGKEIAAVMNEAGHQLVFSAASNYENMTERPGLLIDFSFAAASEKTIGYAKKFGCPLVTGVTGLNAEQIAGLKEYGLSCAVVQSYNYSVGIQMLIKCSEMLVKQLPDWDVEISETHHRFKKDKPSGTALMLKDALKKNVNISSLRLGNVAGDHTVYFGGLGEVISLTHSATSRRTFAEGVLKSAEFAVSAEPGFYSFSQVLFGE